MKICIVDESANVVFGEFFALQGDHAAVTTGKRARMLKTFEKYGPPATSHFKHIGVLNGVYLHAFAGQEDGEPLRLMHFSLSCY